MEETFKSNVAPVMKVTDWLIVTIVSAIPIVNIIMWIVWLASKKTNPNLKNYLISIIVLFLIGIVITGISMIFLGGLFAAIGSNY